MDKGTGSAPIKNLIEKSSLGTKTARAARQTVSVDYGRSIARMAAERGKQTSANPKRK
ncbi:hypothetical protein GS885_25200 [Rhodococcus hoagii]|nr:hypothetical protein [Prescottella equi]